MIKTSPSDRIEDFIDFFQKCLGEEAVAGRVGASLEDIARLADLCRFQLPLLYQGYLREFGKHDAKIGFSQDGYPFVDDLIQFYEMQSRRDYNDVPHDSVVISLPGVAEGRLLIYPKTVLNGEPSVGVFYDTTIRYMEHSSFRSLLYTTAFLRTHFPVARRVDVYLRATGYRAVKPLTELSVELGFIPYWFSDEYSASLLREDESVWIGEKGDKTYLAINARCKERSHRLKVAFTERLPLEDVAV